MDPASFWPRVGEYALSLGLACSVYAVFAALYGTWRSKSLFTHTAIRAVYCSFFFISVSVLCLWACFLTDNFMVRYVYGYSNAAMPIIYKFTALWGGQDGSLLLWLWMASFFGAGTLFFHRKSDRALTPYIALVFSIILIFFHSLILFSDNPFELFPAGSIPLDGRGLNPLLQNPSMAIHPPSLYLGFVGMSVPFAFAIAALLSGQLGIRWIAASRIWTLIAWFFLSIGNLLGAQWAYVELGWGGFWGWDPVENAALLPWLTASAFLHSVMIQEKRGMLKFWNMHLIVLSFSLTILGTYLTRSGVVQSVHSFASSNIGYFFLGFLIFILLTSWALIWWRRSALRSENIFESFLSKESAFVLNNIALVGSAFIILWSTLFPSMSELIIGNRIIVGPPFFNKMLAPFGIALLVLTGVGPVIGWRRASKKNLKDNFIAPSIAGLIAIAVLALLGLYDWYVLATGFGALFVIYTLGLEFYRGARARVLSRQERWLTALTRATLRNHRKYGGYIVHLGLVLIFAGIAGSVYQKVFEFQLQPGQTETFQEYRVELKNFDQRENENLVGTYALLDLYVDGEFRKTVRPARYFYKQPEQPSTEVDIYSRLKEDVYFILGSIDGNSGQATIRVQLHPLISWLWFGGFVLVIGGLMTMLPSIGFRLAPSQPKGGKSNAS